MIVLAFVMLLCAVAPAVMFLVNLSAYRPPPPVRGPHPAVSILIPARDEAAGIADAVRAALASQGVTLEVIVMDDGSTDATAAIVHALVLADSRVRLERAPPLPPGWNGKQHACWALAQQARHPVLCFVDADVRLGPDCVARMAGFLTSSPASLVSGFPRQLTGTWLEWMLLPLIHFVLLGFLPLARMRTGTDPAFAAGCGQFLMAQRDDYFACGGHAGIKLTMHDGLRLPRLFRQHGLRTDLADITDLATCRMYTSAAQTWNGLAKNAGEGLGSPGRILPITLLFLAGQVFPFSIALILLLSPLLALALGTLGLHIYFTHPLEMMIVLPCFALATIGAWLPRVLAARRFRQDWRSALLHPFGILLLLGVQWYALLRKTAGRPVSWRTRHYLKSAE